MAGITSKNSKIILVVVIALILVWSLLPVYWLVNLSFQSRADIFTIPANLIPPNPNFDNHLRSIGLIKSTTVSTLAGTGLVPTFQEGMVNSIIIGIAVTVITLAISIPAGYAFARFSFPFKNLIFFIILFSRSVPPISVVIPYYFFFGAIGLRGTHLGLILIYLTLTVPLITWVLSGFFGTIPPDLDKAARMDGCSRFTLFRKVLLPTAAPGVAAAALLTFLTSWNEFVYALILGQTASLYTLPPAIAGPIWGTGSDVELMMGIATVSLIPPIIAAFLLQKYITRLKIVDPITFDTETR